MAFLICFSGFKWQQVPCHTRVSCSLFFPRCSAGCCSPLWVPAEALTFSGRCSVSFTCLLAGIHEVMQKHGGYNVQQSLMSDSLGGWHLWVAYGWSRHCHFAELGVDFLFFFVAARVQESGFSCLHLLLAHRPAVLFLFSSDTASKQPCAISGV